MTTTLRLSSVRPWWLPLACHAGVAIGVAGVFFGFELAEKLVLAGLRHAATREIRLEKVGS